jgi:hypothetical protein
MGVRFAALEPKEGKIYIDWNRKVTIMFSGKIKSLQFKIVADL